MISPQEKAQQRLQDLQAALQAVSHRIDTLNAKRRRIQEDIKRLRKMAH